MAESCGQVREPIFEGQRGNGKVYYFVLLFRVICTVLQTTARDGTRLPRISQQQFANKSIPVDMFDFACAFSFAGMCILFFGCSFRARETEAVLLMTSPRSGATLEVYFMLLNLS